MLLDLNVFSLIFLSISLVFIFEGILYSLFPQYMKKVSVFILSISLDKIRLIGFVFCMIGILILYII
ncbi:MAG: DUF2065 domain-containing protein [Pelagibacterales bacterium]|nr:DUF2065 domain-containing protein [Pelagibacterales bacterium]